MFTDIWYDLALRELSGEDGFVKERLREAERASAQAPPPAAPEPEE